MKKCKQCKLDENYTSFKKDCRNICKSCQGENSIERRRQYMNKWHLENKEHEKEYASERRKTDHYKKLKKKSDAKSYWKYKEKRKIQNKIYRENKLKDPEYKEKIRLLGLARAKRYREKNRAIIAAKMRLSYKKLTSEQRTGIYTKRKEYHDKYRKVNKKRINEMQNRYQKNHSDKKRNSDRTNKKRSLLTEAEKRNIYQKRKEYLKQWNKKKIDWIRYGRAYKKFEDMGYDGKSLDERVEFELQKIKINNHVKAKQNKN